MALIYQLRVFIKKKKKVLAAQCVNVQYHPRGVHPKFYTCVDAIMFALEMSFAEIIVKGPPFHLWTN